MTDWIVKRPQMFYICKEKGEQCPYATEYGYCQITACINRGEAMRLIDALSLFGEQRKYTDEERKTYLEATKRGAKKLDFNVLDYMRKEE